MDTATRAWLLTQLGTSTSTTDDLDGRYARLGTARAVALEVLRERRQALLGQPLKLTLTGVVSVDYTANIAALERQITALENPALTPAPDDPAPVSDEAGPGVLYLHARPRR